jgi:aspartate racemase
LRSSNSFDHSTAHFVVLNEYCDSAGDDATLGNVPTIGILAGMGPRSTAPFIDQVVTACQDLYGARHDIDFPPIMILSLPTPFYVDRPVNHAEMKTAICAGLRRLETAGVDFIAMPCNTAHAYFDELSQCVGVPMLNMVEETLRALPDAGIRVTLLATRTTVEAGVYQKGLKAAGLACHLSEDWQAQVDALILGIKSGASRAELSDQWRRLTSDLRCEGIDTVVLACTDLNAAAEEEIDGLAVIDSARCLARAVVREYLQLQEPSLSTGKSS